MCRLRFRWYMDRVDATVKKVQAETGATQVNLVAHSAGGWLARAYLAGAGSSRHMQATGAADDDSFQSAAHLSARACFPRSHPLY